jgi:hypothetical protein
VKRLFAFALFALFLLGFAGFSQAEEKVVEKVQYRYPAGGWHNYHYYGGVQRYGAGYWHYYPNYGYRYYRWYGNGYIPYGGYYYQVPPQPPVIGLPPPTLVPDEYGFYGEPYGYYYGFGWRWYGGVWNWHGHGQIPRVPPPPRR